MSRLQYNRSRSSEGSSVPAVDWDEVDEELSRVSPAFRDPRFDSLKHVLTVLSSENAEVELEQLREQRAHIEELVDAVVEGYHSGFNKSIHNYSQILRLFNESKMQLESLRRSLESAKRRLSAQSRHMSQQWQRHITLTDTLRLLDDMQLIVDVPQKLQQLEEGKEWSAAVALLLDGCNKLARQELHRVGALAELKEEIGKRRASLQSSIVAELEARIYKLDPAQLPQPSNATAAAAAGGAVPGPGSAAPGPAAAGVGPGGVPRLQLPGRLEGGVPDAAAAGQLELIGRAASWAPGAPGGGPALAHAASDLAAAMSGMPSATLPRRAAHRRAATATGGLLPPVGALSAMEGHLVDPEVPLATLVDCLAQIGGLADAQAALRKHMPSRLRGAILRTVQMFPASRHLPHDERYSSSALHSSGSTAGACGSSIPPEVAATAQALLEHVLGCCLQVFQNVVRLLHMLATAKAPKPSSGLELLLAQQRLKQQQQQAAAAAAAAAAAGQLLPAQQASGGAQQLQQQPGDGSGGSGGGAAGGWEQQGGAAAGLPPAEHAKAESAAAWDALQCECERLLAQLLGVQQAIAPQSHKSSSQAADVPGEGWLASASYLDPSDSGRDSESPSPLPAESGALTFSLVHEVEGLLPSTAGGSGAAASGAAEGGGAGGVKGRGPGGAGAAGEGSEGSVDVVALVRQILGGHPGGAALVPGLYRPVLQFADAAEGVLSAAAGSGGSVSESSGRGLFSMPWRAASEPGAAERSRLRAYVESFLRMEFLPAAYVDFRARCTSVLEDESAFRPRARLRAATYQLGGGAGAGAGAEGRPLLPAALATEQMVEELLAWAALMPPFATHLTGVVENILGRVLDAFQARLAAIAGGSAAGRLADSVALVRLMVREPSAALLGSPVAFFVGGNTDAMESFVSSVIAAGFGANDESIEREVLAKLFGERPLPPSALLSAAGDAQRLLALAALSDSLDYVAGVIQRCTSGAGPGSGGGSALGGSGGGGAGSGSGTTPRNEAGWQAKLLNWRRGALEKGLTEGLAHLADRYRAAAGACMRVLRLDLLLLVVHHVGQLPRSSYVCGEEEAKEVDECVGALSRSVGRLDEELAGYLPPAKRRYAFCSLAPAAARTAVWLLPEVREINHNGVSRMCRMLASLQPALLSVGGSASGSNSSSDVTGAGPPTPSTSRPEAARQFDKAKLYYTLLTYSIEGLLATVAEKPHRFSAAEYSALLAASVPERVPATQEQRAALQRILAEAGVGGPGGGGGKSGSKSGGKGGNAAGLAAFVKSVVKQQQHQQPAGKGQQQQTQQ